MSAKHILCRVPRCGRLSSTATYSNCTWTHGHIFVTVGIKTKRCEMEKCWFHNEAVNGCQGSHSHSATAHKHVLDLSQTLLLCPVGIRGDNVTGTICWTFSVAVKRKRKLLRSDLEGQTVLTHYMMRHNKDPIRNHMMNTSPDKHYSVRLNFDLTPVWGATSLSVHPFDEFPISCIHSQSQCELLPRARRKIKSFMILRFEGLCKIWANIYNTWI